jgi:hypothetical protein
MNRYRSLRLGSYLLLTKQPPRYSWERVAMIRLHCKAVRLNNKPKNEFSKFDDWFYERFQTAIFRDQGMLFQKSKLYAKVHRKARRLLKRHSPPLAQSQANFDDALFIIKEEEMSKFAKVDYIHMYSQFN